MAILPLMFLLLAAVDAPQDVVTVSAHINADQLQVGGQYEIVLDAHFKDGWSAGNAGVSAPFVQIAVPGSVELTGKAPTSLRELAANDFLQEPYERLVRSVPLTIGFTVVKPPADDDRFGLSFLAYASSSAGDDVVYVRRRVTLPVTGGATADLVDSGDSSWGVENLLQIGDQAAPFSLPKADGTKVALSQFRGRKNVVVTTYRAHW